MYCTSAQVITYKQQTCCACAIAVFVALQTTVDSQSCPIHVENTSTHETSTWRGRCHLHMCWLPGRNGPEWKLSVLTSARILPPWTLVMSCFLDVATTMLSKFMFFCFRFFPHFLCTLLVLLHSPKKKEGNGGRWIANHLQPQKTRFKSAHMATLN